LESRKSQLQRQIIEALKANDNNLYSLLKSQWAHRFGVESLDELNDLDLTIDNENSINAYNKKNDQSQECFSDVDNEISITGDDDKESDITNENKELVKSVEIDDKETFKIKSYEKVDTENHENININLAKENKLPPKVEALIPLPPKPKYSYLNKWLLRS